MAHLARNHLVGGPGRLLATNDYQVSLCSLGRSVDKCSPLGHVIILLPPRSCASPTSGKDDCRWSVSQTSVLLI